MRKNKPKFRLTKGRVNLILILILLLVTVVFYPSKNKTDEDASRTVKVSKVIDGDTFYSGNEKIRMIGINTPETDPGNRRGVEFMGPEAKTYAKKLLLNKQVKLEFDFEHTDQYGRTLAYVYLEDGTFVNADLLQRGYAHVYTFPPNVKHLSHFKKMEDEAQDARKGIWSK